MSFIRIAVPRRIPFAYRTLYQRGAMPEYHGMHNLAAPVLIDLSEDVPAMMTVPLGDGRSGLVDRGGIDHGIAPRYSFHVQLLNTACIFTHLANVLWYLSVLSKGITNGLIFSSRNRITRYKSCSGVVL